MMVYTKRYASPPLDRDEIRRYAGMKSSTPEVEALLDEVIAEASPLLTYTVCYTELPISLAETTADLAAFQVPSRALCRMLSGCDRVVLLAATIGMATDRLLAKYSATAPAKAVLLSAFGTERVERLCDTFQQELTAQHGCTTPRFSPGYGDCTLDVQRDIFRILDCARKIGVTLNDSLMMSPVKSVTAFIGLGAEGTASRGCAACDKLDCIHRRSV